ncbi:MAG: hypothetical protein AAF665_10720 [Pseudomonadota bacterium]
MKRFIPYLLSGFILIGPSLAEGVDDADNGATLMERGAQQFLEGLLKEMEPAWDQMREFMDQMGPAMLELMGEIEDWSVYEVPEVLENGDIIIRRKPDAEPTPVPEAQDDEAAPIEL